jgi:hypothetical protein
MYIDLFYVLYLVMELAVMGDMATHRTLVDLRSLAVEEHLHIALGVQALLRPLLSLPLKDAK